MKQYLLIAVLLYINLFAVATSHGDVRLDGYFIAQENCAALQSIRRTSNPGDIHLIVDMSYEVVSKNKQTATHYKVIVKNASPRERWIPVSCGKLLIDCSEQTVIDTPPLTPENRPDYLLALSWQPAFCQTHQNKTECENQTNSRFDAVHFTLHGLWPQPRDNKYCNITNKERMLDERAMWEKLPSLELSDELSEELIETMPGVASFLHRHEWTKHGSCYSATAEEYFRESIMLTDQVNASVVQDLFANNIGQYLTVNNIRAKFNDAFGNGAGSRVHIKCSEGMISEIWINLNGEIDNDTKLTELLQNADQASQGCQGGVVDPVGF